MSVSIVILAAGQGTRMYSDKPKVLHQLAGKSLLEHVYHTAMDIPHREIHIVYGHGGEQVPDEMQHLQANWVEQKEQLGTAHAVEQALPAIPDVDEVLILYGDVPLITAQSLQALIAAASESGFALMTAYLEDPRGYGRIIRDDIDNVLAIVEDKDADDEQRRICEINTGLMVVKADLLKRWIAAIENNNKQKEYYLTDIVALAIKDGVSVNSILAEASIEIQGINNRVQLSEAERYYQLVQAHHLMQHGVGLMDPSRFDLRGDLEVGRDIVFDINVIFEGRVKLGNNISIGANCYIKDCIIGDDTVILPNTMIDNAVIGKSCRVGPFARIRPDSTLSDEVHIGNFVEIKKTEVGSGSKINHLSYVGDSHVGQHTNIGAGVITCNYDGANKHQTIIGDNVFVGSDAQLIAPVTISSGATIAAGTTVSKNVAENALAITRPEQREIKKWKRPTKKS
ncbi:MAG: bifunctional UDP-N-acetylglucosamine diphosphorylase/glucosamine-1-phosphate N-acetyltransferase GlmU [Gammaproteobacteria bacterium]